MKAKLISYLSQNLDQNKLPEVVEVLIHEYALLHFWWALGWALVTAFFAWQFLGLAWDYEKSNDPEGNTSIVIFCLLVATIWFFFKFIKNIAIFFAPLGDLIQ